MQPRVIEPHEQIIHYLIYLIIPRSSYFLDFGTDGRKLTTVDISRAKRFMTPREAKDFTVRHNFHFSYIIALEVRYASLEETGPTTPFFQPRGPNRGRGQKRYVFGDKKGDVGKGGPSLDRRLSDRSEAGGAGSGG